MIGMSVISLFNRFSQTQEAEVSKQDVQIQDKKEEISAMASEEDSDMEGIEGEGDENEVVIP